MRVAAAVVAFLVVLGLQGCSCTGAVGDNDGGGGGTAGGDAGGTGGGAAGGAGGGLARGAGGGAAGGAAGGNAGGTAGGTAGGAAGGAGGGSLPDSGSCIGAGQPCSTTLPCCGGTCIGLVCTSTTFCRNPGDACTNGSDCCNGQCSGNQCAAAACLQTGVSCANAGECCSGVCSTTCQALPSVGGQTCHVLGETCSASDGGFQADGGVSQGGCCSNLCLGGVCQKAYYCQPNGDLCHRDSDCCGNACSANDGGAGRCLLVTGSGGGACTQEGNPCSDGTGCCSRMCFDPGAGSTVCLPAGGCRLTGTACDNDDSCCGGGINPNGTVQCRTGRCDNGNSCNGVGNICKEAPLPDGGMVQINASPNCCNGGTGNGLAVCKLDSSGIPRCYGGYSVTCPNGYTGQAGCCIATGTTCQFSNQCCSSNLCLPGVDGGYACSPGVSCSPLGASCAVNSECCNPNLCVNNVCRPMPTTDGGTVADGGVDAGVLPDGGLPDGGKLCSANGRGCMFSVECCSQICLNGVCEPPRLCQPVNGVCTTTADCCAGTMCQIPGGSTSGTCQVNSCVGQGQTCTAGGTSCCTGLACLDVALFPCSGVGSCTCTVSIN